MGFTYLYWAVAFFLVGIILLIWTGAKLKEDNSDFVFLAVFGVVSIYLGMISTGLYRNGHAKDIRLLPEETVLCIKAQVDSTYLVYNPAENANYLVYTTRGLPSGCFVMHNNGPIEVTPVVASDGQVVGVPKE